MDMQVWSLGLQTGNPRSVFSVEVTIHDPECAVEKDFLKASSPTLELWMKESKSREESCMTKVTQLGKRFKAKSQVSRLQIPTGFPIIQLSTLVT